MRDFIKACFLLVGTIIGAGVFALPYAFSQSGFLPSVLGLVFLGLVTMGLNLLYSQVIVGSKGDHQLPGYVAIHLGRFWGFVSLLTSLLSFAGALLAYVILSREFLSLAIGQLPRGLYSLWFYIFCLAIFYQGFKSLTRTQAVLVLALIITIFLVPLATFHFILLENYVLVGNRPLFFWGPVLFALTGFSVVPEVEEVLRKKRSLLNWAIISAGLISIILYFIFGFGIWGVSGAMTTVDSLSGLAYFAPSVVRIGATIGIVSLATSFLSLANVSKEVYFRDLKLNERVSKILAVAPAFFGLFLPTEGFMTLVSLIGVISSVISAGLICFIIIKLKPKLRVWAILVFLVLLSGGLVSLISGI